MLRDLNRILCERLRAQLVTVAYLLIDTQNRTALFIKIMNLCC